MTGAKDVHQPIAAGECTKCHSPHKAKLDSLLLASSPDLCLTCHKDLKERMAKEKAHSPAATDCLRCHTPHFGAQQALLSQPIQLLCSQCHDSKAKSFDSAHIGIDAAVMHCEKCHDPHASKDPKFFKEYVHAVFASRSCDECHIVGK